ncbi:CT214 family putative inclusion membrane protein [Chlamydia vaughanii]|uniref:CT214 family putative inclusion membrane protein n=1 Tax=Chlamydia vaughanii TaxID=3112552 RepID=UPI0032B3089B
MSNSINSASVQEDHRHQISPKYMHAQSRGKITQIISAVAGALAAISILITCVSLILGLPIAFSIVTGVLSMVFLALSLVSLMIHAYNMRKVRREIFKIESFTASSREHLRLFHKREPEKIVRPISDAKPEIPQRITTVMPPVPQVENIEVENTEIENTEIEEPGVENPEEAETGAAETEIKYLSPQLGILLDLEATGISYPTIAHHPKYKHDHDQAVKAFCSLCEGLAYFVKRAIAGARSSFSDMLSLATMFLPPLFVDSNPILRVTYRAKESLTNDLYGAFWLHEVLKDPKHAYPLIETLELLKQGVIGKAQYIEYLQAVNVLLAGWCLATPSMAQYIVGTIQNLVIPEEGRKDILKMLAAGNVLGALAKIHEGRDDKWSDLMKIFPLDIHGEQDRDMHVQIFSEELSLYRMREILREGLKNYKKSREELDESGRNAEKAFYLMMGETPPEREPRVFWDGRPIPQERKENLIEKAKSLFGKLGKTLPRTKRGLIFDMARNNTATSRVLEALMEELTVLPEMDPISSPDAISVLSQGIRSSNILQQRLRNYLPYAACEAIGGLVDNIILGGCCIGLWPEAHAEALREALEMTKEQFESLLAERDVLHALFPEFCNKTNR